MIGKEIRLNRIFNYRSKRTIIVPLDHGFTLGQLSGLLNMCDLVEKLKLGGANAVIVHKGMVHTIYKRSERDIGLIVHLSGSTLMNPYPDEKVLVSTVKEAIALGADAVSIHINFGVPQESKMIRDAGIISRDCNKWGIPLLIMAYPKGKGVDPLDPKIIGHCTRVAEELGADIIKTHYPGEKNSFYQIISSCSVPVLIAGGEKGNDDELLTMVEEVISIGGAGVCIGRNIFERENPIEFLRRLESIIHK